MAAKCQIKEHLTQMNSIGCNYSGLTPLRPPAELRYTHK